MARSTNCEGFYIDERALISTPFTLIQINIIAMNSPTLMFDQFRALILPYAKFNNNTKCDLAEH